MKDYSEIQRIDGLIRVGQVGASVDVRVQIVPLVPTSCLHVGTGSASGRALAWVEPRAMVKVVETILLSRNRLSLFIDTSPSLTLKVCKRAITEDEQCGGIR